MNHEPDELKEYDKGVCRCLISQGTHMQTILSTDDCSAICLENYWGKVKQIGDMYSIVASGVGVYGPNIRVGNGQ